MRRHRITPERIIQMFSNKNLKLLNPDEYISWNDKNLKYKCLKCNYNGVKSISNMKHESGCPSCKGLLKTSKDKVIKAFIDANLTLNNPDEYKSAHIVNLKYTCNKCGYQGLKDYVSTRRGNGCPKCSGRIPPTPEEVTKVFSDVNLSVINPDNYIGHYERSFNYQCNKCGYVGNKDYYTTKHGHGCPSCRLKNETECRAIFEKLFHPHKFPKVKPKWLVNDKGNLMEIDGYCDELKIGFEYDGEQHYIDKEHWNMTADNQQVDDRLKTEICKSNNVTLIRIPYNTDDKESFISKCFSI